MKRITRKEYERVRKKHLNVYNNLMIWLVLFGGFMVIGFFQSETLFIMSAIVFAIMASFLFVVMRHWDGFRASHRIRHYRKDRYGFPKRKCER